jgi:organic radical activating enzyme
MKNIIDNTYSFLELSELLKAKRIKVYLYGAGSGVSSYSKIAFCALNYHQIKIESFIDDNEIRDGETLFNIPIISSTNINLDPDSIIFISSNYFDSINNNLHRLGIYSKCYSLTDLIKCTPEEAFVGVIEYFEVMRRLHAHDTKLKRIQNFCDESKLVLNALDIQVTEKCTMKCVDCSNLMQYYEKPENVDASILNISVLNILDSIDLLDDARIIGGEPFLYTQLPSLLKILCDSHKVKRITIYSNATFVPKENILLSLTHSKIQVEITDYNELSKNHLPLIDEFKRRSISFISHKPQNWTDSAKIIKNEKSSSELKLMFERCCVNDVLTLLHGRLYHCPFSANGYNLKAIPLDETDYIDINNSANSLNLREKLKDFYFGKIFLTACRYCLGRDYTQPQVTPAIQVKKPLHYFKILN